MRICTRHLDRVANTPVSYSEGPGFKSQLVDQLFLLSFCGFSQSLQASSGIVP
jgi:hypothetical protein